MYNTILFDLDGTIIDSSAGIIDSLKYTLDKSDIKNIDKSELNSFIGPPLELTLKEKFDMSNGEAEEFINTFRSHYTEYNIYNFSMYDGIQDLLKELKKLNCKLAVATYKKEHLAKRIIKHANLEKYFEIIAGCPIDKTVGKNIIVHNCIQNMNADKKRTILIGDSKHDGIAAVSNNIKFVSVLYGFGFKNEKDSLDYNPVFIAKNVPDILTYVKNGVIKCLS